MSLSALYFIALIPPDDIAREVRALKKLAARHFHSKRALNSPAHITLQPPFRWPEERIGEIENLLREFAATAAPFAQELRDFGRFEPRVIFINVTLNDALQDLAARLKTAIAPLIGEDQIEERPYHPHMTVAFKDLQPHEFYRAWEFFSQQTYVRVFEANALHLLRYQEGKWQEVMHVPFQ